MSPWLISSKALRAQRRPRARARGSALTLAALLAAVAVLGAAQSKVTRGVRTMRVPAPPGRFSLAETNVRPPSGEHVYEAASGIFSPAMSKQLFDFYASTMLGDGWTLQGKSDPDGTGEWTLNLAAGKQAALLTLYTAPRLVFTIDYCPPIEYC